MVRNLVLSVAITPLFGIVNCAGAASSDAENAGAGGATMAGASGAASGGSPTTTTATCVIQTSVCDYGGHRWQYGDTIPSVDDCNTCSCVVLGYQHQPACTMVLVPVTCATLDCTGACNYAGQRYANGVSFSAKDGYEYPSLASRRSAG